MTFRISEHFQRHSLAWLLLLGIAIRCLSFGEPLTNVHSVRQCYTAAVAQEIEKQGYWPMSVPINWQGDSQARILLELPLYQYAVLLVHVVVPSLETSGRLVSLMCWIISFLLFSRILLRIVTPLAARWTMFLYVVSPVSVFAGQAFLTETLIMALSNAVVLALLRYLEKPSWGRLVVLTALGILAVVLKGNETVHLGVLAFLSLLRAESGALLNRPRYHVALLVAVAMVAVWSWVLAHSTDPSLRDWNVNLKVQIGTLSDRLNMQGWTKLFGYVVLLAVTPLGALLALVGWFRRASAAPPFLRDWLAALAVYLLLWGPRYAFCHSYYVLPTLAPLCVLFGVGAEGFFTTLTSRHLVQFHLDRLGRLALLMGLLVCAGLGLAALLHQDATILRAATRIRELETDPAALVLTISNHERYAQNLIHLPAFNFYSGLRSWVYRSNLTGRERDAILSKVRWIVVFHYVPDWYRRLRDLTPYSTHPDGQHDVSWLHNDPRFRMMESCQYYDIFVVQSVQH